MSACGSVVNHDTTDASLGDGQHDGPNDGSTCGGAGQTCCASDACSTGLACTTADHVCRSAALFI
ncbi:MAG TPA: hypothetical protein VGO00_24025, partial [Kofleriaceae bacterium]|nr:hypothetical protein [Kofleriaceae bacterium]